MSITEWLDILFAKYEAIDKERYKMLSKKTNNNADVSGYCCIRFPVTDLKKSVYFYCNVLGYALNSADYSFGEAHVSLKNGNGPGIF